MISETGDRRSLALGRRKRRSGQRRRTPAGASPPADNTLPMHYTNPSLMNERREVLLEGDDELRHVRHQREMSGAVQ